MFGVFEESAPEHEYAVGARAVCQIARRYLTLVVRWQHQILGSLAFVRPWQPDISTPLATFDLAFGADRALEEVIKDALQTGRDFDHHRTVLLEIQVTHGIDHVGIGRGNSGFGVEAILPDRQDVVTRAEGFLRAFLHGVHVQRRQCPDVRLHGALEQQFVLQLRHALQCWVPAGKRQIGQLLIVRGGLGAEAGR